jgi:hypothetical protein
MCDLCTAGTGDHDKPYQFAETEFGAAQHLMLRVSEREFVCLDRLRIHVMDVRQGFTEGPAWGDIAPDGGEWKYGAA